MGFDIERLLDLWNGPLPPDDDAALARVRSVYTDPVRLNGVPTAAAELLAMARGMQASHHGATRAIVDLARGVGADGRDKVAFAFILTAEVDGRPIEMRVVDLLTIENDRVTAVWATAQPAS